MRNERILVTGAGGTIGGALRDIAVLEYPHREFIFAKRTDCDLLDSSAVAAYLAEYKPHSIIHLAAVAGGIGVNRSYPATLLRDNVQMNLNVFEAARKIGVGKLVVALSSGTYPFSAPLPLDERSLHNGYPDESNYGYAFAKRLIDPMIRAYRFEYGMNIVGLLPNNTLGEHSSFHEENSGVVPALIRRFFESRDKETELIVWGDGTPLREISYAKDIARIFMWCLDAYKGEQVLNIGTNEEISIRDIAYVVADVMQIRRDRIVFDATKPSGPMRKSTDTSRLKALNEFSYTPAREVIAIVTNHFMTHSNDPGRLRM